MHSSGGTGTGHCPAVGVRSRTIQWHIYRCVRRAYGILRWRRRTGPVSPWSLVFQIENWGQQCRGLGTGITSWVDDGWIVKRWVVKDECARGWCAWWTDIPWWGFWSSFGRIRLFADQFWVLNLVRQDCGGFGTDFRNSVLSDTYAEQDNLALSTNALERSIVPCI